MPIFITAILGGNVATVTPGTILNKKYNPDDKAQQWALEREGENKIAFKSELDGQYLRATVGQAYGPITTGEKQWWTLEPGTAPGCFWLKSTEFPDAYFANAGANMADGNKIYVWPKQQNWWHALQWYVQDAEGNGIAGPGDPSSRDSQAAVALKEQEEVYKAKEEELARLQSSLQAKDKELQDLEAAVKAREQKADATSASKASSQDDPKSVEMREENERLKKELAIAKAAKTGDPAVGEPSEKIEGPQDDAKVAQVSQDNERLRKELADAKAALASAGGLKTQPWISNAVKKPERKLPPMRKLENKLPAPRKPAANLPDGFDKKLAARAAWPVGRVVELE